METVIKDRVILESGGGEISGRGAETSAKRGASTVDDIVLFVARMQSGALATFEATRLSTGYKNANRLEIHGDKGAIRFKLRAHERIRLVRRHAHPKSCKGGRRST